MSPETVTVVSFDVEEHHRIEAAHKLDVPLARKREYAARMESSTRRLLDALAAAKTLGTFFIVGEIAVSHPKLVRAIADAGHEIGSHSWSHESVKRLSEEAFREEVRTSKDVLEQVGGQPVFGYRAPTFSISHQTPWAIDVLVECDYRYDSSIFPVRHDRYGIPEAPRCPFMAVGLSASILELPPATWRIFGQNLPVAGGGYFRLFPWALMRKGLNGFAKQVAPAVGMTYFHPWEFDADQPQLPLGRFGRWRTYTGTGRTAGRFADLLRSFPCRRAIDVVDTLNEDELPRFQLTSPVLSAATTSLRP